MPGYLYATKNISVSEGQTKDLGSITLLGGDANNDNVVNIFDLTIVGVAYGTSPPSDPRADINERQQSQHTRPRARRGKLRQEGAETLAINIWRSTLRPMISRDNSCCCLF